MPTNRSSSGVALIVVLILSAMIYLAVSTLWLMTMTEIHLSDFERRSIRALYLAESAIAMGVAKLRTDPDHPAPFSDIVPGTFDAYNVGYTPILYDEHESWYHFLLEGEGVVSGPTSSATRRVLREIVQKPFTLLARNAIELQGNCRISGHIHSNHGVNIGPSAEVEGHISPSSTEELEEGIVFEPEIRFPLIPYERYGPTYLYHQEVYNAQALNLSESFELSPILVDGSTIHPPAGTLNLYQGQANPETNPAGVFYLNAGIDDDADNTLSAIDLQGGTLLLGSSLPFHLKGFIRIDPVEHFPALLQFGNGDMTFELMSFDSIKNFLPVDDPGIADIPQENHLKGLLYSPGTLSMAVESGTVDIEGSLWAGTIVLACTTSCTLNFAPRLLTNPPPGLQVVEYGEWRELLD